jgi:hypothetical protein
MREDSFFVSVFEYLADPYQSTAIDNPAEAETVRRIFKLYRELDCVRRVTKKPTALGLRTKCSTTADGTKRGGKPFSRRHIYGLLRMC